MLFDTTPSRIGFPFVEQAAQLTRCIQNPKKSSPTTEMEYLITSRSAAQMNAQEMLEADRKYWGIETGLHLRLDVIAGEDRSRVRTRNSVMNLAVLRRAAVTLAVHWIRHCKNPRLATTSGFFDFMSAQNGKKAFKLVTASKPSWLPGS